MKLKVCGMKMNTLEVATLNPDYLGFIFWEPSKRFFKGTMPELPTSIKKVGVFVDASLEEIMEQIFTHGLKAVQLHGNESPEYCGTLKKSTNDSSKALGVTNLEIIKVFSIKDDFDFSILTPYEAVCDFYLFDTKGKLPGGNGFTFCWEVLKNYPSTKPYFLSGGIGLDEIKKIKEFQQRPESKYCYAIDVNSKFETEPGLKDVEQLKKFKKEVVKSE
ncbi:phosphoribosylanthranilate isomerase [Arenibacter sp. F20364]|uniref:phosphoribosylanthranilate isomerase n=1 Tax=Arenibacter sp. F20364 TaxID=2926415 RepID=UPI001FF62D17|nr:phosphoribosylanthranilate isomerase [Arenibacter sp. F20364]MCK0191314.1 phosphoribosylanthranilate isomerase [Arenibacter sp. F20364]